MLLAASLVACAPARTADTTALVGEPERHYEPYVLNSLGEDRTFYSSHEQDKQLIEQFPWWLKKDKGTFLEMGALDGKRVSNTKFFYDSLGWRGVLVEPQSACREMIAQHRPEDTVFANASCADFKTLAFDQVPGECVGGVGGSAFLTDKRKKDIEAKTVQVGCSPIGHMLKQAGLSKVDLWSLDVEGSEHEVLKVRLFALDPSAHLRSRAPLLLPPFSLSCALSLQGMDWAHIPVHALLIEMIAVNHPRGEAALEDIRSLLRANGFKFVKKMGTAAWDELWENESWYSQTLPAQ